MTRFKLWWICFALLSLPLAMPAQTPSVCLPRVDGFKGYNFLNPAIIDTFAVGYPILTGFDDLYKQYFNQAEDRQRDHNLDEWVERVCDDALPIEVYTLIYKSELEDLEQLRVSVATRNMPIPYSLSSNGFAKYLYRHRCLETVDYLLFAKRCEPYVVGGDPWEEPKRKTEEMRALIQEGRKTFLSVKSHFLRMRYAYQVVRLAHYAGLYQEALDLYDYFLPKIDIPIVNGRTTIVYYWALGHRAGALRALGRYVEASYWYSHIFQYCPSKQTTAFQSFYVKTDDDWKQLLLMCRDDKERATLYAIRAHSAGSRAVEEMQHIYELDPKNEYLEVLLLREMRELEKDLLGLPFNEYRDSNRRYFKRPRPFAGNYVITMQRFAHQLWKERQVGRPELWLLAEGYLTLLAGDYYAADLLFQEVADELQNKNLREQLAVFQLACQISAFQRPDDETEQTAYDIRKSDKRYRKYPEFHDYLRDRLATLYRENGRPGKAYRCYYGLRDLQLNPEMAVIDDLLKLSVDTDRNQLERLLLQDEKGKEMTYQLWNLKAMMYLQNYQLEAALEMLKQIPRETWSDYGEFSPFKGSYVDCVHCPREVDTSDLYNRGELIEKLIDLEYRTRAELDDNAKYFYLIGMALYNMSYFGHAWNAMDPFRSGASWNRLGASKAIPYPGAPNGNVEMFNLDRPLYYFDKARQLAKTPEVAARATFMAAKCEQLLYYMTPDFRPPCCDQIPPLPEEFSNNYRILKEDYGDTEFYQDVIRECLYFRAYALK